MPTYQYQCKSCGADLEVVQKFSDPSLTECPECSGELRKVFNAVGVVFKGSGFYRTDSRGSSSIPAGKKDKDAAPAAAKPAAKESASSSSSSSEKVA
ncbi:MAG: zinc ribbon domain-containing protein [Arachnia sp.]